MDHPWKLKSSNNIVRSCSGSHEECVYELMKFGIPAATLTKGVNTMKQWLKCRVETESAGGPRQGDASSSAVLPELARHGITEHDVLFGKASGAVDHPGTIRLRNLIDRFLPLYESSSRREKTSITDNIIRTIQETNGRFMKFVPGFDGTADHWEEVSHAVAREKTAHTFRNRRRLQST